MKIAIVGSSEYSRHNAPYKSPDWEIWGLGWHAANLPRWDRLFELHSAKTHAKAWGKEFKKLVRNNRDKFVMLPKEAGRFKCKPYPLAPIKAMSPEHGGRKGAYATSSIAYMLAYAALQKPTHVHIAGIDMADDTEYVYQRPCAEYWIGYLRGQGAEVTIAEQSAVCSQLYQYGVEDPVSVNHTALFHTDFEDYCNDVREKADTIITNPQYTPESRIMAEGVKTGVEMVNEAFRRMERGGKVEKLAEVKTS